MPTEGLSNVKPENLTHLVIYVRGERAMLDSDLAALYGVTTGALNRSVKRNLSRFPEDFMFSLNEREWEDLRCQIGISRSRTASHGGRRGLPCVFTEQGIAMLSSVLRSQRATQVNIAIMRTFVQLRRLMDSNRELARKIEALEKKYDEQFAVVFDAIKRLVAQEDARKAVPRRRIGFIP
jgi:hypothetical protein